MARFNGGEYVGLWQGGPGYSQGEWATDAEVFDSLQHAKAVLAGRYARGSLWPQTVPHVAEWREAPGGESYAVKGAQGHNLMCPAVAEGSSILLARRDRTGLTALEVDGPHACTYLLEIGPRGGVKVTRL